MSEQSEAWESNRIWITKAVSALEAGQIDHDNRIERIERFEVKLEQLVEQAKTLMVSQERLILRLEKIETFQTKIMAVFVTLQTIFGIVVTLVVKFWK